MKLLKLHARSYRSLRDADVALNDLNVFIGANASGKSSILDALRFLSEGVRARDFRPAAFSRGGILHMAWKGEGAVRIELTIHLEHDGRKYEWSLCLMRRDTIEQRSPSFKDFVAAVLNGSADAPPAGTGSRRS